MTATIATVLGLPLNTVIFLTLIAGLLVVWAIVTIRLELAFDRLDASTRRTAHALRAALAQHDTRHR